MIINFQMIEIEKINKNFEPFIDFSIIEKSSFIDFPTSIFLKTDDDGYIPIVLIEDSYKNNCNLKSLIVEYELSSIKEMIEDKKSYTSDCYQIIKILSEIILNLNTKNYKNDFFTKDDFYKIFSFIFIFSFFKNRFESKPAILLYLLYLLTKDNIKIFKYLKDSFKFYSFLEKKDSIPKEFYIYLITIDADKSLLFELKNIIDKFTFFPKLNEIIKYILICKLNKNRLRRFIFEIYRLIDLQKLDEFLMIVEKEDVFFNDSKITSSQKEIKLSNIINKIINPSYSKKYENFNKIVSSLNLGLINIKPSLFFEKNEFSISANIKEQKELEILKDEIIKILENKDNLFDF